MLSAPCPEQPARKKRKSAVDEKNDAPPEAMRKLNFAIDLWGFDVFLIEPGLFSVCAQQIFYDMLRRTDMTFQRSFDGSTFVKFLRCVFGGYADGNPYHNGRHALDVLQATHHLMSDSLFDDVSDSHRMGVYLASVCHDLGHPALNNAFYAKTGHQLALLYGDISVLEHVWIACAD